MPERLGVFETLDIALHALFAEGAVLNHFFLSCECKRAPRKP